MDTNIEVKNFGTLNEKLFFNKKVSISYDNLRYDPNCDYKVMVQIEPPQIFDITKQIIRNKNNFDLILTWHKDVLENCSNSKFFPFGSCWIDDEDRSIHDKNKLISMIMSGKRQASGHVLRHTLLENLKDMNVDLYGRDSNYIEKKISGLKDYMFSIVIENQKIDNWFTEKIIDCLVTGTVPVFWGCSNIGDFFDTNGFIIFDSIDDFNEKRKYINETTYKNMLPYIKKNFDLALNYANFWKRIKDEIDTNL